MTDMLQMSYSEMESLAAAFESASNHLKQMGKAATVLMIQVGQMTNQDWVKATNEAIQKTEDTAHPLNQIMESVEGVWQGERYQDFSCNIYPSVEKSLNDISQEFTAFLETLRALNDTALLEMGRILRIILTQSIECNKTAVWIQNYTVQHMCAEKGIDSDKMNDVLGMSADQKRRWIHANTSYPGSVIQNVGDDVTKRNQSFMSFDEADAYMEKNDRMVNGKTSIYDLHTTKNADGSGEISFICANSTRRSTEITVYDENGNVVRQEYMDGYYDPKNIEEVFLSANDVVMDATIDIATGRLGKYNEFSFNSKQLYSVHVPKGGYVRITEDASMMDTNYAQEKIDDLKDEFFKDHLKIGASVSDMAKDVVKKGIKTIMGPSGTALTGIETIMDTNHAFDVSQTKKEAENSNGDGALYFYVG